MIIIIALIHAAILWTLNFFLYPELIIYPYLTAVGFLPYKDILDQHFPGLLFFPLNFNTLGFTTPVAFKTLLILIVISQSFLIYKIAKKIGNRLIATLSSFSYMLWQPFFEGNQLWLDIFLPLFTLPAFWFFLGEKWITTGLFLGLAIVFKQTLVPLVAFVGLLILLKYRSKSLIPLLRFGIAAVVPSMVMLLYFDKLGILSDFWYWTVQFNLTKFAAEGSLAPRIVDLVRLTFPVFAILAAWMIVKPKYKIHLIIGWMLFTVVGGSARFGLLHFQPAIPYFSLVFGLLLYSLWDSQHKKWLFVVGMIMALWMGYFYSRQRDLFQTKFYDQTTQNIVNVIEDKTDSGDKVFLLGVQPHLYYLSKTLPPGRVFVFQFPWFFKVAGDRILQGIKDDPPMLIVYDSESNIDGQYLKDYGQFLLTYIRAHYFLTKTEANLEYYENWH